MDALRILNPGALSLRERIAGGSLFLALLIANQAGITLFTAPAVIVPGAGIALAGLVLGGLKLWPFVYAANLIVLIVNGAPSLSMIVLPIAQTIQPVVGAYLLEKLEFDPLMRRLRDSFALMGVGFVVSAIVPSCGLVLLALNQYLALPSTQMLTWGSWWTGHILSLLVVAPLVIRWGIEPNFYRQGVYLRPGRIIEIAIVFAVLIAVLAVMGFTSYTQIGGISLTYIMLVPLFWLAIRIGPRFTILGIFLVTSMLIVSLFSGPGAASAQELGTRLFEIQILSIILAVIFYIIAGLQEERTEAAKSLNGYIAKLEDALNRLSLQDRAKNDFIAVLAHELRNPLAPIVSTLELVKLNFPKTGEEKESFELIDDRLKTIQRLLDDLLDVSRISRAKLKLKKEPVRLRTIIQNSIQAIERHVKNKNQELVIDIPDEDIKLEADPVRLEQVVTNLLSNASKFTPPGGRVAISARREGVMAIIKVADNGIGIDPEMLERIFEPFLQLESGERKGEGLGIGLSLTQRLVEMHNGTIEAHSLGHSHGSEFIVRLPTLPQTGSVHSGDEEDKSTPPPAPRIQQKV
ncbi:MAG TPA: ATP-binding protein, partial [Candidatus Paceibacterota bacterium]|nr:ATP-binding protein [Candidatus Paceibacterota bacterium]